MLLCIWTAIHMNIEPALAWQWTPLLRKVKWAVIGILAPEVVLCAALEQYRQARWVCQQLDEVMTKISAIPSALEVLLTPEYL